MSQTPQPSDRAGVLWDSGQQERAPCLGSVVARLRDVITCLIFFGPDEPLPWFINELWECPKAPRVPRATQ